VLAITATFWSAALLCRFRIHGRAPSSETSSNSRDFDQHTPRRECRRRIVRQKDQKDSRAEPNAYSDPETSEDFSKESDGYANADFFAETKESFSESIANRHAQKQIKAQESISYSNTE
jgi:hypothetical protein